MVHDGSWGNSAYRLVCCTCFLSSKLQFQCGQSMFKRKTQNKSSLVGIFMREGFVCWKFLQNNTKYSLKRLANYQNPHFKLSDSTIFLTLISQVWVYEISRLRWQQNVDSQRGREFLYVNLFIVNMFPCRLILFKHIRAKEGNRSSLIRIFIWKSQCLWNLSANQTMYLFKIKKKL